MRLTSNLSIGKKVVFTFIGSLLLTFLVLSILAGIVVFVILPQELAGLQESITTLSQFEEDLETLSRLASEGKDLSSFQPDYPLLKTEWRTRVVDVEGKVLVDSEPTREPIAVEETLPWLPLANAQGIKAYTGEIVSDGERFGYYILEFQQPLMASFLEQSSFIERLVPAMVLGGLGLGFLISLLLFAILTRHLVIPIRHLSSVVKEIAGGNLEARVKHTKRHDEIGSLANDINSMASQLEQANLEAKQSLDARRYFVAAASHDLRSPLTAILAHAEGLLSGMVDNAQASLEVIYNKGILLKEIIQDLFELSSLDLNPHKWVLKPVDLGEVARQGVIAHLPEMEKAEIEVDINIPEEQCMVNGEKDKLDRAIENMIANAIKHAGDGRYIGISLRRNGEFYRLEVTDRGEGIDKDLQQRIFEPFVMADRSRSSRKGSGLGLTITKQIIQGHHGNLGVDSTKGKGSTFWVELPQVR